MKKTTTPNYHKKIAILSVMAIALSFSFGLSLDKLKTSSTNSSSRQLETFVTEYQTEPVEQITQKETEQQEFGDSQEACEYLKSSLCQSRPIGQSTREKERCQALEQLCNQEKSASASSQPE
ncbi:hypothetical protein GYA49_00935 [Candidatus Beckwithbacteria bacterium]|nr:hypothetical protein [Candidatus Beckwithbacteria bacterium]